jgi:predicted  nucleic acid-binding Zn-ribbon protein
MKSINARWEKAGKVPRDQMRATEDRLKAVEAKIKRVEDELWRKSDPATIDRTNSVRTQLEAGIAKLEAELEAAKATGDAGKISKAQEALDTKKAWLEVVIANS